jgi:protein CrcB
MVGITGPRFPWGTLLINVLGSFVIGLVAALTLTPARVTFHPDLRVFVMVGVCGGFTTFSAFSLQTLELLQSGPLPATLRDQSCYAWLQSGSDFSSVGCKTVLCVGEQKRHN